MTILIHRTFSNRRRAMEELTQIEKKLSGLHPKLDRDRFLIRLPLDTVIDYRTGDVMKTAGMRPDYYICDDASADFIKCSAEKCNGIRLFSIDELCRVIIKAQVNP